MTLGLLGGLIGTTSACAENTVRGWGVYNEGWNYLRVRGEYETFASAWAILAELPPRARRIP